MCGGRGGQGLRENICVENTWHNAPNALDVLKAEVGSGLSGIAVYHVLGGLELLKIETRLIDEKIANAIGEYVA